MLRSCLAASAFYCAGFGGLALYRGQLIAGSVLEGIALLFWGLLFFIARKHLGSKFNRAAMENGIAFFVIGSCILASVIILLNAIP